MSKPAPTPLVVALSFVAALVTPRLRAQLAWADPQLAPPALEAQHAFFDEPRGRLTVYGGSNNGNYTEAAWSFDGSSVVPTPTGPAYGPRAFGAIATDPSFPGRAVVFGGRKMDGSLYDETLRWNDATAVFERIAPTGSIPPARWLCAMALDTARNKVVMFGGGSAGGPFGDTWEWDGAAWQQKTPSTSPPARNNHAMAYDAARGRIVLFGGHNGASLDDTWTFDGVQWSKVTLSTRPSARHDHAMAYDARRNVVVLFAGKNDSGIVNDEIWEWDGTSWRALTPAVRPPARELCSLVFDSKRQLVTLYGGSKQGTPFNDVWSWSGTAWTNQAPKLAPFVPPPPSARTGHASVFDSRRNRIQVFGGTDSTGTQGDLWEWDFAQWERVTGSMPPARSNAGMAYDSINQVSYLIGGFLGANDLDTTLWGFSGTSWSIASAPVMPTRSGHACVFDTKRAKLVVFGGFQSKGSRYLGDTWEFDSQSGWTQKSLTVSPSARSSCAAVFDSGSGAVMVFGGLANGQYSNELWKWDGGGSWKPLGAGGPSPRADAVMSYDAASDSLVLFGGRDANGLLGDLWWHTSAQGWSMAALQAGTAPSARMGPTMTYDGATGRHTLFGGLDAQGVRNDLTDVQVIPSLIGSVYWLTRTPEPQATVRRWPAAAFDHAHAESLLFGGADERMPAWNTLGLGVAVHLLNDTLSWNGATWTRKSVAMPPPPRSRASMAFDRQSSKVVLFGGRGTTPLGDTWTWDGSQWSTLSVTGPSARFASAFVSLWPQNGAFLFGGADDTTQFGDTYRFATTGWQLLTSSGPPARWGHAMAFDSLRNKVVLFGGQGVGTLLGDTWEYDLTTLAWSQRLPATIPVARAGHVMAFDAARGRVVMTDGSSGAGVLLEVWEWDGMDWTQRSIVEARTRRVGDGATMWYDAARGRCVAFGGRWMPRTFQLTASNQVTELWAAVDGAGRGMGVNPKLLRALTQPMLGGAFKLWFENPSNIAVLTLGLGPVQAPTAAFAPPLACGIASAYTDLRIILPYASAQPGSFSVPIPYDGTLLARSFVFQGVALQSGGSGNCLAFTDALNAVFQRP